MTRSEKFTFPGSGGHDLAGRLDLPEQEPRALALFAHCFTCGKDVVAAEDVTLAPGARDGRPTTPPRMDTPGAAASSRPCARAVQVEPETWTQLCQNQKGQL